jgi:hypothetical protein
MRSSQQVQPQSARLCADTGICIVVCEPLHDSRVRQALRSGDPHARIGVLARKATETTHEFRIAVMGNCGAPFGGILGLPTGFAEEGGQFHRLSFTAGS